MVMGCDADADADAFDVVGSAFDEKLEKSGFAGGGAYAEETAYQKAADVASRLKTTAQKRKCLSVLGDQAYESLLVLGCDTVVEVDGTILEKPADARHATEMLELLRGNVHQVHTGVALIHLKQAPGQDEGVVVEANMSRFYETTDVTFDASIPDDVLDDYVQSGEPMDKAGRCADMTPRLLAFVPFAALERLDTRRSLAHSPVCSASPHRTDSRSLFLCTTAVLMRTQLRDPRERGIVRGRDQRLLFQCDGPSSESPLEGDHPNCINVLLTTKNVAEHPMKANNV